MKENDEKLFEYLVATDMLDTFLGNENPENAQKSDEVNEINEEKRS